MILLNRKCQHLISLICFVIISPLNDSMVVNGFSLSSAPSSRSVTSTTRTFSVGQPLASFQTTTSTTAKAATTTRTSTNLNVSSSGTSNEDLPIDLTKSYVLTKDEISPLVVLNKGGQKEKWINAYGILYIIASIITAPVWWSAMAITDAVCNAFPDLDPHRSFYDKTGKIWSKVFLAMTDSSPTVTGDVERLKSDDQPCLYVANHASWLDIPVLCTVLSPVFKFISKAELLSVPCIGKQLSGGNHILIDREDRRSQLRTFKEGVAWLSKGVPLMAFPEGQRSSDGKLLDFKGGIFSMATRAKVPIVPLSISNTHAVMPSNALFPFQAGAGKLHVHVHPPIDVDGKSEDELANLVRTTLLSKMPLDQHPLPKLEELEEEVVPEIVKAATSGDDSIQQRTIVEGVPTKELQKVE